MTSKQLSVAKSLAMEQSCTVSGCCESRARAAFLTMALAATTWTNQRRGLVTSLHQSQLTWVAILASPNWLCCVSDSGRPNCFRT